MSFSRMVQIRLDFGWRGLPGSDQNGGPLFGIQRKHQEARHFGGFPMLRNATIWLLPAAYQYDLTLRIAWP